MINPLFYSFGFILLESALISIRPGGFVKKKIRSIAFFRQNWNERLLLIQLLSCGSPGSGFQGTLRCPGGGGL